MEVELSHSISFNGQWWKSWLGIQSTPFNIKQKDYHKPGYWKDWYWNKGGREKVNLSKKVNQVLNRIEKEKMESVR